ncbi:Uncharacterized protein conserved in bacteria [Ewingella americana]|uniref:Uncharacterized protein conserved in bacteria n=1 Tax=Ewingella americana TaxID=41202 RepID=A0A377NCD2_9GAMM|nr:Uncharacterized protein conserved in bacteria [Ewingella americana]
MNQSITVSTQPMDIDALLADTWLQLISLRQGMTCGEGEGRIFWQRCVDDIKHVQQALKAANISEQSCQHVMYAQCAVLDETVKGRNIHDDIYFVWCDSPLQAHFFKTLDAGSQLYERVRQVLREPAADLTVLICFHRVLMLGFKGGLGPEEAPNANSWSINSLRESPLLTPRQPIRCWLSLRHAIVLACGCAIGRYALV